jgi:uncharacterized membrane protein YcaP (DUF421 family)
MLEAFHQFIGPDGDNADLTVYQMSLRALIVFVLAVGLARLGSKRFMARNSAFDLILAIMLGSILSRAITGQSPFFPTLAAGATVIALHYAFAFLAFRFQRFGYLIKGRARLLVKDGEVDHEALRRHNIGEHDLTEALRMNGNTDSRERVEAAYLERGGEISVLLKKSGK